MSTQPDAASLQHSPQRTRQRFERRIRLAPTLPVLLAPVALGFGPIGAQSSGAVDLTPTLPPNAPVPLLVDATFAVGGIGTDFANAGSGRGQARIDIVGPDPSDPTNPAKVGPPDGILDLFQVNSNSPALPLSAPPGQEITPAIGTTQFPCVVYRGELDGSFTDVTAAMSTSQDGFNVAYPCGSPWGLVAGDFDDDGDLDLVFPCGGFNVDSPNTFLLNNGNGTFTNTTVGVGLSGVRVTFSMLSFDYDRDGLLDLYEVNSSGVLPTFYQGSPNPDATDRLWQNSPTGFVDRAIQAEVDLAGNGFSATAADLDRDGWLDIALSCFRQFNKVFYNEGDGSFSFMTPASSPSSFSLDDLVADAAFPGTVDFTEIPPGFDGLLPMLGIWSMPVDVRDLNQDGWLDVMFHSWSSQLADDNDMSAEGAFFLPSDEGRVYLNRGDQDGDGQGDGLFREAAQELGIAHVGGAMGALTTDLNGDGFDDVYVGGGGPQLDKHLEEDYLYVQEPSAWPPDFQADPDQPLDRVFYEVGALAGTYSNIYMAHGLTSLRGPSGRRDVVVGNGGPALFNDGQENVYYLNAANSDGSPARYFEVALNATAGAPGAFGARVEIVRDGLSEVGRVLTRERRSASVFASHDGAHEQFAIGGGGVLFVNVEWPSGVRSGELLWPAHAGVEALAMTEPTLSVALEIDAAPGDVDLSLAIVETSPLPKVGGVYFLSLHPSGVPGLFLPLLFLEVANAAVFAPGVPFQIGNSVPALPLGLYVVVVLEFGTTNIIGASSAWHDPAIVGAQGPGAGGPNDGATGVVATGSFEQGQGTDRGQPMTATAEPARVPRTHVAPRAAIATRTPWVEIAPAQLPLVWDRVSTDGQGERMLPSGDRLRWEDGSVELQIQKPGQSDVSFLAGEPWIVLGRAMGCCEVVPTERGTLLRFGQVEGSVVIDGVEYAPNGMSRR